MTGGGNARPLTRARTTLNLSSILDTRPEPLTTVSAETPQEFRAVTPELIRQAWEGFRELQKDRVAIHMLLQKDLAIEGTEIRIQITNPVEEQLLDEIRTDLLTTLREKLGNPYISLIATLIAAEQVKTAYTSKEKFDQMAEKYPIILELKDRLGLDSDY